MPTIIKRTDHQGRATYQARVRKAGLPPQSKTFPTRKEAEDWGKELEVALAQGTVVSNKLAEKTLMKDLFKTYLEQVTPTKKGKDVEEIRLKALMRDELASYKVSLVNTATLAKHRDKRLKEVSGSTVSRELNLIGHVLEKARKEWGFGIKPNIMADLEKPKEAPHRERRLRDGEEERLLAAADATHGGYLKNVIILAIDTAMRQGEIRQLRWEFLDTRKHVLHLKVSKDFSTKNGKSRVIPLTIRARQVFKDIGIKKSGPVFPGLTAEAVKQAYARTTERAGISDLTFHDLRHEATSRLFEKGLTLPQVQAIQGDSLASLQRYVHAKDIAALVEVMG